MEIVGDGFIARNLAAVASRHDDVVALAAGVPSTVVTADEQFRREAELVYATVRRCREQQRRLVFFSTCSAAMYGDGGRREDGPVYPLIAYGRHNLALEAVLAAADVDYLVLRLTHLIGPFQRPHQMFARMVRQIRERRVEIYRDARRDVLDVAHMVRVLDDLLTSRVSREVVNVASGVPVPVEAVVRHIEGRMGVVADHTYVENGSGAIERSVSIDKLTRLVPAVADMGFGPDYYRAVVDRHLPWYLDEGDAAASPAVVRDAVRNR